MKIRTLLILLSFFICFDNLYASERQENIEFLYKAMGMEYLNEITIQGWKNDAVRLTPNVTHEKIEKEYKDIFKNTLVKLKNEYIKSFEIFSDEEIQKFVEFHKTSFGQWYSQKNNQYNTHLLGNATKIYGELNSDFFDRFMELNQKP